jgi:peptidoglycan/LPS O-acetylase OafA/YrhL
MGLINPLLLLPPIKENAPVGVYWTLCYEVYFYFVLSFFLEKAIIRKIVYISISFIFVGVTSFCLFGKNFFSSTILFEFVMGMYSYYLYAHKKILINKFWSILIIILSLIILFLVAILFPIVFVEKINTFRFLLLGGPAFLIFCSLILCKYTYDKNNLFVNVFSKLGKCSYSLYLVHFTIAIPILSKISFYVIGEPNTLFSYLTFIIILSIGSIFASWFFYTCIEKKMAKKFKEIKESYPK